MPSTWSLLDEKKLLINIIEISGVKMPSWAVVAEKMDGGYTAEACRQHFKKLKKEAVKGDGSAKPNSKLGTQNTPRKRKQLDDDAEDDAEDDEMFYTPKAVKDMDDEDEYVRPAFGQKVKDEVPKEEKDEEDSSDEIYD